jgi:hypothetical protein
MDIERTMQFIVENLAAVTARLEKMAERQGRVEDRQAELAAEFNERMMQSDERHEREISAVRNELRRAIRYSVEEHKRERIRRHEVEDQMKQLAAGQEELRKSMQKWLDRGGNGHQASS